MTMNDSPEYIAIVQFYADRKAERSGLPLINHINEGLRILTWLKAPPIAMRAFCLHPIFQNDADFAANWNSTSLSDFDPRAIALAVEYRSVANESLSHRNILSADEIRLSPVPDVNAMLKADKIQNRKDFELHHKGTHPRSDELAVYFALWLERLGVSEEQYQEFQSRLVAVD